MFGYVRPFKPQLRLAEYDAYKGIYCGLCRQLGHAFGPFARFTLSYDFAFLAALGMAVSPEQPTFEPKRCPFAPIKKAPCCCENPNLAFSADVAMLMLYHKLRDNQQDGGFWDKLLARLALMPVEHAYRRAAERNLETADLLATTMLRQYALEQAGCTSIDEACEPTATALAGVCALFGDGNQRRVLERMGYLLGRYVYMIDALDDLEKDIQTKNYNPFVAGHRLLNPNPETIKEIRENARPALYLTISELGNSYNLLETTCLEGVLENILYIGLKCSVDDVLSKERQVVK